MRKKCWGMSCFVTLSVVAAIFILNCPALAQEEPVKDKIINDIRSGTVDLERLQTDLQPLTMPQIESIQRSILEVKQGLGESTTEMLRATEAILEKASQESVKDYPPDKISINVCAKKDAFNDGKCYSRVHGFAYAYARYADGGSCYYAASDAAKYKSDEFLQGTRDWFLEYKTDDCSKPTEPPIPARCIVGFCSEDYKSGLVFRPAVELGSAVGKGFGFDDRGFIGKLQFSSAVGARYFWWDDKMDVRFGLGIVGVPMEEGNDSTNLQGGVLYNVGFGFFRGLFGLGLVAIQDVSNGKMGTGFGLSVDLVSIQNLLDRAANP